MSNSKQTDGVLLTIAIPTFNRGPILKIALEKLLPQIESSNYKRYIQLVISDNASEDNTGEILSSIQMKHPDIKLTTFLQPYNTGYYGNFKTCRELSDGKYFWLLSDNEHICPGFIDFIMHEILSSSDAGVYFINNKISTDKPPKERFFLNSSTIDEFLKEPLSYRLTLISAVIMLNTKSDDEFLFEKFNNNSFLGFALTSSALKNNRIVKILSGPVFNSIHSKVSFDIFEVWTNDIMACVDHLLEIEVFNTDQRTTFITNYLKNVLRNHILEYKVKGHIQGKQFGTMKEIKGKLDKHYGSIPYYNRVISKSLALPKFLLVLKFNLQKAGNRIRRLF